MSATRSTRWRGNGREGRAGIRELKQGFEVGLSRVGEPDNFEVDDLLSREAHARDEPGDGGMEPEDGAKNLFTQVMSPIAAAHVEQFVTGNRGLEARIQRCKTLGKEHNRREKAEGDGRIHLRRNAKLGGNGQKRAHGLENGGGFLGRSKGQRGLAETAKFEEPERKDGESQGNSCKDDDPKKWRERLEAGKMPLTSCGAG